LQRSGRASAVLCGAAEEFSPARARLEALTCGETPSASPTAAPSEGERPGGSTILGEGCAMVLLEPGGRPAGYRRTELAELLALEFGVYRELTDVRPALAGCMSRVFTAAHESPARLWAAVSSGANLPAQAEDAALAEILGDRVPVRLRTTDLVGDAGAASATFGLTALLALAAAEPAAHGRTALLTAVDRDGVVGCALLRLATGEEQQS
jgi:3-oxoacyl-[acyl-carrier-protein] synthase II